MEKGDATGKDTELDALLSAADGRMINAIRESLDLNSGFTQILSNLAGADPVGRVEAEPDASSHSDRHALNLVRSGEPSHAPRRISTAPVSQSEPLSRRPITVTLALMLVTTVNILILFSLSQNHGGVSTQFSTAMVAPRLNQDAGPPPGGFRPFPPQRPQVISLRNRVGASVPLRLPVGIAGVGDNPIITYLKNSGGVPILLLSGVTGGKQFPLGAVMCIAGTKGHVVLKARQNESDGQIEVIITTLLGANATDPNQAGAREDPPGCITT